MITGKVSISIVCVVLSVFAATAQNVSEKNASATLRDNNVDVKVDLELEKGVKTNNAVVLTPVLRKGNDSVEFPRWWCTVTTVITITRGRMAMQC